MKDFNSYLQESSLSRLWKHSREHDYGTITAFRYAPECGNGTPYTKKENLKLLDDTSVSLDKDTLVISDQSKVLAMAGIMGGEDSSVGPLTDQILLESAWFNPKIISGKARKYGKHTDSSHRFERGVDPEIQHLAIERATSLILDIWPV